MPKSHRVEEVEPGIWRYSDGTKRYYGYDGKRNGSLAAVGPYGASAFTPATATLAVRRKGEIRKAKHQKAQGEAERALQRATRSRTPAEGWGKLTGAVAKRVLDGDEPLTGVVTAYKAVGQSAGMLQERGPTQATQVNITLSGEAAEALQDWGVEIVNGDRPTQDNQPSEYAKS